MVKPEEVKNIAYHYGAKGGHEDPDDLDYDEELERIESLPWHEQVWEKRIPQRILIAALAVALLWSTSLAFVK